MRITATPPPLNPPPLTVNTPLAEEWTKKALESNQIALVKEYIRAGHHLGARALELLFARTDSEELFEIYLNHVEEELSAEECTVIVMAALASRHYPIAERALQLPYDLDFRYPADVKWHEHHHDYPRESFQSLPAPISAHTQQLHTVSLLEVAIGIQDEGIVQLFLDQNPFAGQALLIASAAEMPQILKPLHALPDSDIEASAFSPYEVGETPLLRAAFRGDKETIHILLELGANDKATMFHSTHLLKDEAESDGRYCEIGFQSLVKVHPHLSHLLEEEGIEEEHHECCTIL